MAQRLSDLALQLKPYVIRWIEENGGGAGGGGSVVAGAPAPHSISSSTYHSGTLADAQAPQFLLRDGSRSLTGNLLAAAGVTIDGVDVGEHAGNANAHHNQAHVLATAAALGPDHTVSGLTAGHVLKATGATAAAFGQLLHSQVGGIGANDHHAQAHVLATAAALGPDHTVSGLTAGHVLRATGATAASFSQLLHSQVGGIGAADHHDPVTVADTSLTLATQALNVRLATNAGLEVAAGLKVKPTALLSLTAAGVGITAGAAYQFVGTGAGTAATWRDVSNLSGAGMTHTAGALNVIAGDTTLTVSADSMVVNRAHSFDWSGRHTFGTYRAQFAGTTLPVAGAGIEIGGTVILSYDRTGAAYTDLRIAAADIDFEIGAVDIMGITATTVTIDADLQFVGAQSITTSSGALTLSPVANLVLDPGNLVELPNAQEARTTAFLDSIPGIAGMRMWDAGSNQRWLSLHGVNADELHVRAFVADIVRVDIGEEFWSKSRGIVFSRFKLPGLGLVVNVEFEDLPDLGTADLFAVGDKLLFRTLDLAAGLVTMTVWFTVTSKISDTTVGGTDIQTWQLTRSSGGTVDRWIEKGATCTSVGQSGQGWVHLSALDNRGGPFLEVGDWTVNPWTTGNWKNRARFGHLSGFGGMGDGIYGIAAAKDGSIAVGSGYEGFVVDATNGANFYNSAINLWNGVLKTVEITAAGNVKFGNDVSAATGTGFTFTAAGTNAGDLLLGRVDAANILWDRSAATLALTGVDINLYTGTAKTVEITSTGNVKLGSNLALWATTSFYHVASTGQIRIGNLDAGNILWEPADGQLKFRNQTTVQAYVAANGQIYAGGGAVRLNAAGLSIYDSTVKRGSIDTSGDVFLGSNIAGVATTQFALYAATQVSVQGETMGAGDIIVGNHAGAHMLWDASASQLKFRDSALATQAYVGTDGMIYAGAGAVRLGNDGARFFNGTFQVGAIGTTGNFLLGTDITGVATTSLHFDAMLGELRLGNLAASNILWDPATGRFNFREATTVRAYVGTDGRIYAGGGAVRLGEAGVDIYASTVHRGHWQTDGDLFLGSNINGVSTTQFALYAATQVSVQGETMGAGDIIVGNHAGGHMMYDASAGQLKFRNSLLATQAYVDTDGTLVAGGGKVVLDSVGINLQEDDGWSGITTGYIKWSDNPKTHANNLVKMSGGIFSEDVGLRIWADASTGSQAYMSVYLVNASLAGHANREFKISTSGEMRWAYDTDAYATLGRAFVGYNGYPDYAGFGHIDYRTATGYAVMQDSTGKIILNTASNTVGSIRVNSSIVASWDADSFDLASNIALTLAGAGAISSADSDTAHTLGRAKIGYDGATSDTAVLAHRDHATAAGAGFKQTALGFTVVNAASTRSGYLQVAGATVATWNADRFTVDSASELGEAWVTATYQPTYSTYGAVSYPAQYKRVGDMVFIRGRVKGGGTSDLTIFNLPAGYRPTKKVRWGSLHYSDWIEITISDTGNVDIMAGLSDTQRGDIALDGLWFSTAA